VVEAEAVLVAAAVEVEMVEMVEVEAVLVAAAVEVEMVAAEMVAAVLSTPRSLKPTATHLRRKQKSRLWLRQIPRWTSKTMITRTSRKTMKSHSR
jgi:hypothetical protein